MANFIYNSARRLFAEGKIDWLTNTGRPAGSAFTDYKIMVALVNKSGGSGIQNYTPPADPNSDTAVYTITSSRNMKSDFGWDQVPSSSSLIRDGSDAVITAELAVGSRTFIAATGACAAGNITFVDVPVNPLTGTYGALEAMVIYLKNESSGATTTGADWPVLMFIDTLSGGGMSITPNGGDIVVQWNASGIFRL